MSATGAGHLREWFSQVATRGVGDRWLLTGACPADNKYCIVTGRRLTIDSETNTEIWYCNYCKIIVTNGDVKLIDKNKIQRLLIGFSFVCPLTGA